MYALGLVKGSEGTRPGILRGGVAIDLASAMSRLGRAEVAEILNAVGDPRDMNRLIDLDAGVMSEIRDVAMSPDIKDASISDATMRWGPPVGPGKLLCAGANYPDHADEMDVKWPSDVPMFFFPKLTTNTLIGDGDPVKLPSEDAQVDWEVELAVVVGRTTRGIRPDEAMDYVAGYTILNDVTARRYQMRAGSPFELDWLAGKSCDTFAPLGPCILPAHAVEDWRELELVLRVNGEVKQRSLAGEMIHGIEEQISYLSSFLTLEAGDVIGTGTPSGTGAGRGESLASGDVMTAEVMGIGTLRNECIAG